jgi:uncharacterized membrane protein YoaK (UPF0700 family)
MFRHRGSSRTFTDNFRLAAFLSFTSGIVNICGVLAVGILTTNVTGHFAFFAQNMMAKKYLIGVEYLLFILVFLLGSFVSNFLAEYYIAKKQKAPHNAAIFLEIFTLLFLATSSIGGIDIERYTYLIASVMLFAMGIQNSLVSKVSNSIVRTTHLTGLFTDLGIELSQLFFYKDNEQRSMLRRSIGLRLGIIFFFFLGCILGGVAYMSFQLKTLYLAALVVSVALVYDNFVIAVYKFRKRFK